jgi:hypothetical protein
VAVPQIRNSDTARETDDAIDHHQLAMCAVVDLLVGVGVIRVERVILVDLNAGVFHLVKVGLTELVAADAVDEDADFDSRTGSVGEGIGELAPDMAGPENVRFERDSSFGVRDCIQHGRENLVAVAVGCDFVARDDGRPQEFADRAREFRIGDAERGGNFVVNWSGHGATGHQQQRGHDDDTAPFAHSFPRLGARRGHASPTNTIIAGMSDWQKLNCCAHRDARGCGNRGRLGRVEGSCRAKRERCPARESKTECPAIPVLFGNMHLFFIPAPSLKSRTPATAG